MIPQCDDRILHEAARLVAAIAAVQHSPPSASKRLDRLALLAVQADLRALRDTLRRRCSDIAAELDVSRRRIQANLAYRRAAANYTKASHGHAG